MMTKTVFSLLAAALLLGACENTTDWDRVSGWFSDLGPSAGPSAPAPVPTSPPAQATALSAVAPVPPPPVYRVCRECPLIGDRLAPVSDRLSGAVERIDRGPEALTFVGWAVDQGDPNGRLRLLVFADGAAVAEGTTGILRLDVIARLRLSAEGRHGFQIAVPSQYFRGENIQVNIYAMDPDGALGVVRFALAN